MSTAIGGVIKNDTSLGKSTITVIQQIAKWPDGRLLGILKRKRHYEKRFTSKKELVDMIQNYIRYNRRMQRNLGVLKLMEKYNCAV